MESMIERVRQQIHDKLDYSAYDCTTIQEETNCYAHALGATTTLDNRMYIVGRFSHGIGFEPNYIDRDDLRSKLEEDLNTLGLKFERVRAKGKFEIIDFVENFPLKDNQHIIVLFSKEYRDMKIRDFHFIRYDNEKKWSEKSPRQRLSYIENIKISWPSFWIYDVATYVITR